jgi:hypothetical protein
MMLLYNNTQPAYTPQAVLNKFYEQYELTLGCHKRRALCLNVMMFYSLAVMCQKMGVVAKM